MKTKTLQAMAEAACDEYADRFESNDPNFRWSNIDSDYKEIWQDIIVATLQARSDLKIKNRKQADELCCTAMVQWNTSCSLVKGHKGSHKDQFGNKNPQMSKEEKQYEDEIFGDGTDVKSKEPFVVDGVYISRKTMLAAEKAFDAYDTALQSQIDTTQTSLLECMAKAAFDTWPEDSDYQETEDDFWANQPDFIKKEWIQAMINVRRAQNEYKKAHKEYKNNEESKATTKDKKVPICEYCDQPILKTEDEYLSHDPDYNPY